MSHEPKEKYGTLSWPTILMVFGFIFLYLLAGHLEHE